MSDLFSPRFAPPPPPPAPPLPPQRYVNRAANAISRFAQPFIGGSRPPSSQANRAGDLGGRLAPGAPRISGPLSSQTATHQAGVAIAAVDISPQRTHAVLAGRDVLKTICVSGANCTEEFNLRAGIFAYTAGNNAGGGSAASRHRDDLAANDVKWSHGNFDSTIATAAPNGKIVLFDINRSEVQIARLHEHNRQVHKLAINPHQGYYLLSGSQDGTIRLWDLRATAGGRHVSIFRSLHRYKGNAEGIRDVKWSPTDGTEFAVATDVGVVQRWDFRKDNAPLLKLNAHRNACLSIDWHPDGKHLISAGLDKKVHVWDFSSFDRRQNASWSFEAPKKVSNVRWRPVGWHASGRGLGMWQTTQVVTSYNEEDPRIHVWNLKRPDVPFREIDRYDTPPTDLLWHSEDLLWTVGNEGIFTQTDMHFVPKIEERQDLQAFDLAPNGKIASVLRKRPKFLDSVVEGVSSSGVLGEGGKSKPGSGEKLSGEKLSGEKLSGSRSTTDEEASGNFLTSSFKRRTGGSRGSKSSKSVGNTPPSESSALIVTKLDETLKKRQVANSARAQLATTGQIDGIFDVKAFKYLASRYFVDYDAASKLQRMSFDKQVEAVFTANSSLAETVRAFRLAQTWKVISYVTVRELQARGQVQRALRLQRKEAEEAEITRKQSEEAATSLRRHEQSEVQMKPNPALRAIAQSDPTAINGPHESSSNVSTPLARPVSDNVKNENASALVHLDEEDTLMLPSSAHDLDAENNHMDKGNSSPTRAYSSGTDTTNTYISTPDWYNTAPEVIERRKLMGSLPSSKPVLRLDPLKGQGTPSTSHDSKFHRLDSQESFPMFSESINGSDPKLSLPNSFSSEEKDLDSGLPLGSWSEAHHQQQFGSGSNNSQSHATSVTDLGFSSSGSEVVPRSQAVYEEPPHQKDEHLQASGTIVPDEDNNPHDASPPADIPVLNSVPPTTAPFIRSDFVLANAPHHLIAALSPKPPFNAASMLPELLKHYTTQQSDLLLPSSLILLLQPLIDLSHDCLSSLQAAAILSAYHGQLVSLGLFVPAAHLRKLTYPNPAHRSIWEPCLFECRVTTMCSTCGGRLNGVDRRHRGLGNNSWVCERCPGLLAPCPVCWCRKGHGLWAWCQGCGHGGHERCMGEWWASPVSEGGCATEGCRHDCVPGVRRKQREEQIAKSRAKARENRGTGVRRDEWVAGESRAVERVRSGALLAHPGAGTGVERGNGAFGSGIGGSSGGSGGNSGGGGGFGAAGLGGKRVKVVTPSEEGRGWRD
ncbi:MAG: SEA (Seh1-associated) complex subunit [Sclerophora amabilis]|nr:MAG: SEA (Seh1-associated) complex subunit [Sclerophora amabilis]